MSIPVWVLHISYDDGDTVQVHPDLDRARASLFEYVSGNWERFFEDEAMPEDEGLAIDSYFEVSEDLEDYTLLSRPLDIPPPSSNDEVDLDEEEVNVVIAAIEAAIDSCQKSLDHLVTDPSERKDMEYAIAVLNTSYEKLKD